jgi:endo-1,4-beta-xylanase
MGRLLSIVFAVALLVHPGCNDKNTPLSPTTSPTTTSLPPAGMEVDPLRVAAQAFGKLVGAAVPSNLLGDARYAGVLGRHFNYLTAEYEMKWDAIERAPGSNDFSAGDAIVSYGQANGMQIKGHALIWHGSVPAWVGALSAADFRVAFENHIRSVAEHIADGSAHGTS